MAIITVPAALRFSKISSFTLQRATNILRSKYTGQAQRITYPYAVWELEASLVECDGVQAGQIRSFLAQLEGQKNSFRVPVPGYNKPTTGYVASDATAYTIAAARASSLTFQGLTASRAIFNEGDYFTVNDECKIVTAAAATDINGRMTVSFKPALRAGVAVATAIKLQNPTVLMTAKDDDVAKWGIAPPIRQTSNFSAVEALDI